jgi:hypothetical protein
MRQRKNGSALFLLFNPSDISAAAVGWLFKEKGPAKPGQGALT